MEVIAVSASIASPVALEDFLNNPDIHYYDFHELHNGAIVEVSPPSNKHLNIQKRLERMFESAVGPEYTVWREFYYTLPTEGRRADVAVVLESRRPEQGNKVFFGSPDLLVEFLSPSNSASDLGHLRRACLAAGTGQFWIVDPSEKVVEVYYKDGTWKEFHEDATIQLHFAVSELQIPVASIFKTGATE